MRFFCMQAIFISIVQAEIRISLDSSSFPWTVTNGNESIQAEANVPGGIFTDLQAAGILNEDLFYRFNDHVYRWVAYDDWTYKTTFQLPPEVLAKKMINLVFHGLDTVGDVFVNGKLVASVDNMFVRHVLPVKDLALENNTLEVRLKSPVVSAQERYDRQVTEYLIPPSCVPDEYQGECHVQHLRKMQASFSWDWGPAFPSIGIWKSVEIEAFDTALIRDINVVTYKDDDMWNANITAYIESATDEPPEHVLMGVVDLRNGTLVKATSSMTIARDARTNIFQSSLQFTFRESEISLWWPNGYGSQRLYETKVRFMSLSEDEETSEKNILIGFRTIELVEEPLLPDLDGYTFYFKVNDVPIFAKGANWIPGHILPELSYDESIVRHAFLSCKEANMNMLRVWGGGLYESELFYQTADELGILIWQDMMFASAMYPADSEFLSSVAAEAEQQVSRLQRHVSLAIWSGNNENEGCLASNYFGTDSNYTLYKGDYVKLYVDVIGTRVAELDPSRYYEVSCPSNGLRSIEEGYVASNPGSALFGDVHYYNYGSDPWDSSIYPDTRFASEYGFQSWPSFKSISRVSLPEDWTLQSEFSKIRQHHPGGLEQITKLITFHLPLPEDDGSEEYFNKYIYYNQISQALAIKTETEKYRRDRSKLTEDNKGHTMGALYWQLNDVWQGPSWSSIEYGGRWKVLHYYAMKFFAPVLVSPENTKDDKINVHLVSDLLEDVPDVELNVTIHTWDSLEPVAVIHSERVLLENATSKVYAVLSTQQLMSQLKLEPNDFFVYFALTGPDIFSDNVYYPSKSLIDASNLQPAKVTVWNIVQQEDSNDLVVSLETDTVAPFVWLETDVAGQFSDNGFTLHKNIINITFSNWGQQVDLTAFSNTLSVRSLLS